MLKYWLKNTVFGVVSLFVPLFASVTFAQSDTIKIGAVTALSAPGAVETGQSLLSGMKIAVDKINKTGGLLGKQVELVVGDTAGLPAKGTTVMERLINKEDVVAVAGELHSSVALAEIDVAHRYGIPIVISEAWADAITAKCYPEVFRLTVSNSLIYSKAAKWLANSGFKHVAIIAENSDWGRGVIDVFQENLKDRGVKVTAFTAERSVTDFTPQLLQIKRLSNPAVDFIVNGFTGTGELLMVKQAYQLGIAPTAEMGMLGAGMDVLYPGFWETAGEGGKYLLANPAGLPGIPKTEVSESFTKAFKAKHGREPDAVAMEGYDSIMVIAEAIRNAQSTESEAIIDALEQLSWTGTRGTINFSTDENPDKAWTCHQWMDVPVFIIQFTEVNQAASDAAILWPEEHATVESYITPSR